jgi:benzoyl-CoA reductase subunit C
MTGMENAMSALEAMKKHYAQRDLAAREWKEKGGKVVGRAGLSVPEELIIAAGCLPILLTGNPYISSEQGNQIMEDYFCPHVRSVHNQFVVGNYDFLDLAIFPNSTDSMRRCYYYLWYEKHKLKLDFKIPPMTIFDILHTQKHIANKYVRGRVEAMKEEMEEFSGNKISDEALADAVAVCNENRRLLKKVAELRRDDPPKISGMEALQIIGASFFIPKKEHNRLLKEFLDGADQLPAKNGARLYLSGSILDNLQLYELIESCGAVIVGEDVCTGNRYSDNPIDTSMEALDAITDRYHTKTHEGRIVPASKLVDYVVSTVKESQARGIVFHFLMWDDAHPWNYPSQRDALDEMGIPSICFEMQEYKLTGPEQLRTRIEALIEMVTGGI